MQFDSVGFFLAAGPVILISYLFPQRIRNWFLVLLSLLFCAAFSWSSLFVLVGLILVTYGFSILLEKNPSKPLFVLACILCAGLLVLFRFYDPSSGILFSKQIPFSFAVPVGVSFYTLNAISYLSDLYTGKLDRKLPFVTLALFLSFFPTVTSGPLMRAGEFAQEADREKPFAYEPIRDGFLLLLIGYVMKLVIAGRCALMVNHVYMDESLRGFPVVLAVLLYSLEIYTDFAGYSLIAKGLAKALGFAVPDNFHQPYFSASIREFWRRWHMSLSGWLKDYVYIPLGGSHGSRWFKFRNLILTFLVSGFWHGRGMTFLFWGLLHALFQIGEDLSASFVTWKNPDGFGHRAVTFLLVTFAWIFFASTGMSQALSILARCFSLENYGSIFTPAVCEWGLDARNWCFLGAGLMVLLPVDLMEYHDISVLAWFGKRNRFEKLILVWICVLLAVFSLNLSGSEFIYMQF